MAACRCHLSGVLEGLRASRSMSQPSTRSASRPHSLSSSLGDTHPSSRSPATGSPGQGFVHYEGGIGGPSSPRRQPMVTGERTSWQRSDPVPPWPDLYVPQLDPWTVYAETCHGVDAIFKTFILDIGLGSWISWRKYSWCCYLGKVKQPCFDKSLYIIQQDSQVFTNQLPDFRLSDFHGRKLCAILLDRIRGHRCTSKPHLPVAGPATIPLNISSGVLVFAALNQLLSRDYRLLPETCTSS